MGDKPKKTAGEDLVNPFAQLYQVQARTATYRRPLDIEQGDELRKRQAVQRLAELQQEKAGGHGLSHEADDKLRLANLAVDELGDVPSIVFTFAAVPVRKTQDIVEETTDAKGVRDEVRFRFLMLSASCIRVEFPNADPVEHLPVSELELMFGRDRNAWSEADYRGMCEALDLACTSDNHADFESVGND